MAGSNGRAGGQAASGAGAGAGGERAPELPVHATIPTDFAAGFEIQQRIIEACEKQGFTPDEIFALKIATEEALVNAIKHGNKLDKAKTVRIEASVTPDWVHVEIEDQGAGFDRMSIPDPLADENIEKPSGRGILLIESYMTEVHWTRGGRRLHMVKRRTPIATPGTN
jgi:serine/threonine-protein kinase RsbW